MTLEKITAAIFCLLLIQGCAGPAQTFRPNPDNAGEIAPRLEDITPPTDAEIRASMKRGIDFLLQRQNPSGSWGRIRTKGYTVTMPVPMGFDATRAATTAMALNALVDSGDTRPEVKQAIQRGEAWLLENLPKIRICSYEVMYNNWTHAYGISSLVALLKYGPRDPQREEKIRAVINGQIERLHRNQHFDGGWGYYNFAARVGGIGKTGDTPSFMTGAILVALHDAKQAGFAIPENMPQWALAALKEQRRPDFAYTYTYPARIAGLSILSHPAGSLARSQACNLACKMWGDKEVTDGVMVAWLDRLIARNEWLSMARKTHQPHEGHWAIAGYFYYYAHYYAAREIEYIPESERPRIKAHLAKILMSHQESSGSWFDFAMYDFHEDYGTSYALMSLNRCLSGR